MDETPLAKAKSRKVLAAVLVGGSVLVALGLVLRFPNLRGSPVYLGLVVLTPLLLGGGAAILLTRMQRCLSRTVAWALGGALAVVLILDLIAFAAPLVITGPMGADVAPTFTSKSDMPTTTLLTPTATSVPAPRSGTFDARPGPDTVAGHATLGYTNSGLVAGHEGLRSRQAEGHHGNGQLHALRHARQRPVPRGRNLLQVLQRDLRLRQPRLSA
jgi:hypothetical protein